MLSKCSYFQGVRIFVSLFFFKYLFGRVYVTAEFLCNVIFIYFMSNPHVIVGTLDVLYIQYTPRGVSCSSARGYSDVGILLALMSGALLTGAIMSGTLLTGAVMSGALLSGAVMSGALLSGPF